MTMRKDMILTLQEVADMVGVTLGSVRQWRHHQMHGYPDRGVKIRQAGNKQLYCLKSDVEKFVATYRPCLEDEGGSDERDA